MTVSLTRILRDGKLEQPFAIDTPTRYTRHDWLNAVVALLPVLQAHPARRWLLTHESSWQFVIGLFALLAAGKEIILPPNTLTGTLDSLRDHADALLGDGDTCLPRLSITGHAKPLQIPVLPALDAGQVITLFTSGSTGEPKPVRKTLACLDAEIQAQEKLWGSTLDGCTVFATVSHQHLYGLLFRLLWPVCAGRPFAVETIQYPEMLMAALEREPSAVLVSSPSQLGRFAPATGNSLPVMVFSSGAPLPFDAARAWQITTGQAPVEVLGSTETGGVAWRRQTTADTPWQPLHGVTLHGDSEGLLWVQSPLTGEAAAVALGDRGQLTDDGLLTLAGRADRIAKIEGKRLSLAQMEQQLCATGLVSAARVLPLPGGRLAAVAVPNTTGQILLDGDGKRALADRLRNALAPHFERVLLPRKWRFPPRLPQNALGKTTEADLLALFSEQDNGVQLHELSRTADSTEICIDFAHGTVVFAGHFPDLPILPGVVQFDLAVRQCERWYPLTTFRQIDKLKFQEPIVPGDSVTLSLQHLGNGQVQFAFQLTGQPMSSGRIVFATPPLYSPPESTAG